VELFSSLIAAPRVEPPPSFEALVTERRSLLYAVAYRLTGNRDDTQDPIQESVLDTIPAFQKFRPDTRFDRWMLRIITHNVIDRRRVHARIHFDSLEGGRRLDAVDCELDLPDSSFDPAGVIVDGILDEQLKSAHAAEAWGDDGDARRASGYAAPTRARVGPDEPDHSPGGPLPGRCPCSQLR
jgi:DNA-directed RNA polymerase specialized sigma24 family protein